MIFDATQRVAPVDQRHARGKARQERRFLERRIAAADDGDRPAAKEEAVAGGARRDAVPHQRAFRRQPSSRADAPVEMITVRACTTLVARDLERPHVEVDADDVARPQLRAEPLRLSAHAPISVRAHDAVLKSRKVLDIGRQHQLPASFEALEDAAGADWRAPYRAPT